MNLREDWFGRTNEGFTYKSSTRLLDWESFLEKSQPYSTFLGKFNPKSVELKFQIAKSLLYNIKNIMLGKNSNSFGIYFNDNLSYTDLISKIVVQSSPLEDNHFPTFNHALDVIIGSLVHESAHVLYTPSNSVKELKELYGKKYFINLFIRIVNIIEDERINKCIGDSFSGFSNYLSKSKLYYFKEESVKELKLSGDFVKDIYNSLVSLIRYPSILPDEFIHEFEEFLVSSKTILTPYPDTFEKVVECSVAIYELIKDKVQNDAEEEQKSQEEEKAESGEGEKSSNKGTKGEKSDSDKGEEEQESSESFWEENKEQEEGKEENSDSDEKEISEELKKLIEKKLSELDEKAKEDMEKSGQVSMLVIEPAKKSKEEKNQDEDNDLSKKLVVLRTTENSELPLVIFEKKAKPNKEVYLDGLSKVGLHVSSLAQKLNYLFRDDSFTDHGLKEGELDEDSLADYVAGSPNIYQKENIYKSTGGAIVFLIDHSGSTNSEGIYVKFREVAILFCEALKAMQSSFEFYAYSHGTREETYNGYTTDYTNVIPLIENDMSDQYTLGSHRARNEANRDGQALLFVVDRVKQLTEKPITVLMINDGEPAASCPPGFNNVSYTKHCVDQVEAMGIDVIQISISSGIPSHKMFKKFVTFTDYGSLVKNCGDLLYKIINDKQA